jgi:CDP-4-dehydro-6-deoxyglucose reductase
VTVLDQSTVPVSGEHSPDTIAVTLWENGLPRPIEARVGEPLMFALKRAGLGLLAVCGGKGACGTCKVAFPSEWAARVSPPEKRELRLLTHLKAAANERLSCRIQLGPALQGLQVYACE